MKMAKEGEMCWSLTQGEASAERMATNTFDQLSLNENERATDLQNGTKECTYNQLNSYK
jgi:hypothetical protein